MKPQTLYRVNENKKVKLTKAEKVYDAMQKDRNKLASPAAPKLSPTN